MGPAVFPGSPRNPQHIFGPSWSVRLLAAPRSMGPAVFLGSPRNPQHIFGPSRSVRLLAAPRSMGPAVFPGLTAKPATLIWSLLEGLAAPRSMGPAVFLGSPPTRNTHLVPPGVCGSWPLLAVWDPRFSWAHRQPTASLNLKQHIAKVICDTMTLTPKCQRFNSS